MDNEVRNIAPFINVRFRVTSPWWTYRDNPTNPGELQLHRGLDIATSIAQPVYSILDGYVHSLGYSNSRGNWIIIKDPSTGIASLYMHLAQLPVFSVGTNIRKNQLIGIEGDTGDASGIHLHVEMQNIDRFNNQWYISNEKSDYIDPTEYMGIDNIYGTWWIYDGHPFNSNTKKKSKFPWVLYARKLRNKINVNNN